MQSVSSRIWTRVAVSISYDDNHYTTNKLYMHKQEFALENEMHNLRLDLNIKQIPSSRPLDQFLE